MKLTPEHRLYGLGAVLLLALAICSQKFSNAGEPSFIIWLVLAGIAYLLAIREFLFTPSFPRRVIVVGLALTAVWHVLFLLKPPGSDDDIHRYVWDGRVQRLGYNPYVLIPNDPAVTVLHTPETRALNHPDMPSPYPAGAQLFFRVVTAIHESVFAMKVAFVLCDLAIVLLLFDVLRRSRQPVHWVLAYAWNPLLATDVAGSGHIDILGALLLLISVAALWRNRRALAAVAFALAIAVKFLPIVLVPLFWRRLRVRDALLGVFVFGLLYLPFLERGRIPTGSLIAYVQSFRFNDPGICDARAPDRSTRCSRAGGFRRLSYRDMDGKKLRRIVTGRLSLAHGSIAFICTGCVFMVSALAAAVFATFEDGAACHLDREHPTYLLRLASAHDGTTMGASRLDHAAGIWSHRGGWCCYRVPSFPATPCARSFK